MADYKDQYGFVKQLQVEHSSDGKFILCGLLPEDSADPDDLVHFILHRCDNEIVFASQVHLLLHALQHQNRVRIRYDPGSKRAFPIIAVRLHALKPS